MITGPGNPYVAEAKRQLFGSVGIDLLADRPKSWSSPTTPPIPRWSPPICLARPSTARTARPGWSRPRRRWARRCSARSTGSSRRCRPRDSPAAWARPGRGRRGGRRRGDRGLRRYAPEHLEVQTADNDYYLGRLRNYGSSFSARRARSPTATRASAPTTRCRRPARALHWRALGRQVHQDRHLPAADRRRACGSRRSWAGCARGGHARARDHRDVR